MIQDGGVTGDDRVLRDTWAWDGRRWVLTDTAGPREIVAMALVGASTGSPRLLAVRLPTGQSPADRLDLAVWRREGRSWVGEPIAPLAIPPAEPATEIGTDRSVLIVAGWQPNAATSETWRLDQGAWSRATAEEPPRRRGAAICYDPDRRVAVLFGGGQGGPPLGETWEWNGTRWVRSGPP